MNKRVKVRLFVDDHVYDFYNVDRKKALDFAKEYKTGFLVSDNDQVNFSIDEKHLMTFITIVPDEVVLKDF